MRLSELRESGVPQGSRCGNACREGIRRVGRVDGEQPRHGVAGDDPVPSSQQTFRIGDDLVRQERQISVGTPCEPVVLGHHGVRGPRRQVAVPLQTGHGHQVERRTSQFGAARHDLPAGFHVHAGVDRRDALLPRRVDRDGPASHISPNRVQTASLRLSEWTCGRISGSFPPPPIISLNLIFQGPPADRRRATPL